MRYKGIGWTSPVNHELLCSNSLVKVHERALRNLSEMLAMSLLLVESGNYSRKDLREIHFSLPFGRDTSTALGLVLKYHLEHYKDAGYKSESLKQVFPACAEPAEDLKKGFAFWGELVKCLAVLPANAIPEEVSKQFSDATKALSQAKL